MPSTIRRRIRFVASHGVAVALAFVLAGCGDDGRDPAGGDDETPRRPPVAPPTFIERTADWGVDVENACRFTGDYVLPEIMGQGVAVFDANGDGRLDLYVANGGPRMESDAPDQLLLAVEGGGFRNATEGSGLGVSRWSTGVGAADLDNDGDVDLYVGAWGADRIYLNDGSGHFADVTASSGIAGEHLTTSIGFLDYDQDGLLDVFVVHYVVPDPDRRCGGIGGGREYCGPGAYTPVPDALYRNLGGGKFEDVSVASGVAGEASSGLGVAVADLDGDGLLDIYVANDQRPNHLWRNNGDGTFEETAIRTGVALSGRGNAEASMGVDVADVNGDGRLDIFITHIAGETNTLYLGTDKGAFRDASVTSGVGNSSRPMTAFGTVFGDVDLDGDVDLLVANGRVSRARLIAGASAPGEFAAYAEPDQLLLNNGDGYFIEAKGERAGLGAAVEMSRGMTCADLDADGDLDAIVTSVGGPVRVFENVGERRGHWLRVLACEPSGRAAVGARIEVRAADVTLVRLAGAGWSYLCTAPSAAHFGLGDVTQVDGITVVWPGGEREAFPGGKVDRAVRVVRGEGTR